MKRPRRLKVSAGASLPATKVWWASQGSAGGGVLLVHPRGGAEVADHDPERLEVVARLSEAVPDELGPLREVHLALDAAQLDGRVAQAVGLLEDRLPFPAGASEGGEGDGQAL